MEKKYRLKPFDIERAKAGEPVCTKKGEDVRILCCDKNDKNYPIVALVGQFDTIRDYTAGGNYYSSDTLSMEDLMMKVEVKEPYVYADVAGEIRPYEELKAEGFIDLESLNYLIIKTYDGKFLKIWKKALPEQEWKDAQVAANTIGMGWRCPTRHECIDIYDARFKGLDDAMKEIGGDTLEEIYWTSEVDSDTQYTANHAVCFCGYTGNLYANKLNQFSVRPVQSFEIK